MKLCSPSTTPKITPDSVTISMEFFLIHFSSFRFDPVLTMLAAVFAVHLFVPILVKR